MRKQSVFITYSVTLEKASWDWRDASVAKQLISCSSRGQGFNFQHLHGDSQLSVIPVHGGPMSSSDHSRHCIHAVYKRTFRQTCIHIQEKKNPKSQELYF